MARETASQYWNNMFHALKAAIEFDEIAMHDHRRDKTAREGHAIRKAWHSKRLLVARYWRVNAE